MSKLIVAAVLAVSLLGTASAAGKRSLRLDARDEASFTQSLNEFKDELTVKQWYLLRAALNDIWDQSAQKALIEQREYTAADYLRQVDGLGYKQIVRFTDPTGKTEHRNSRAFAQQSIPTGSQVSPGNQHAQAATQHIGFHGEQLHGSANLGDHYP